MLLKLDAVVLFRNIIIFIHVVSIQNNRTTLDKKEQEKIFFIILHIRVLFKTFSFGPETIYNIVMWDVFNVEIALVNKPLYAVHQNA